MTDKLREAAQAALKLLDDDDRDCAFAARILKAALAEPAIKESLTVAVQERMHPEIKKMYEDYFDKCFRESSAQQRPWVGLTDDERDSITDKMIGFNSCCGWEDDYAKAIEAKLKEKNGG
jgi:hypothetical protein